MPAKNDCVIVGSGMGGLAIATLLTKAGKRVTLLEAHPSLIGGYAQTIQVGKYQFAAGPRYLWNFGPGEPGYRFLAKCGLLSQVPLVQLDRGGFNHIYFGDEETVCVPNDWDEYASRLSERFPAEKTGIFKFFQLCRGIFSFILFADEAIRNCDPGWSIFARYATSGLGRLLSTGGLVKRSRWTLQDAFDNCGLSHRLQAILYAHGMVFALPKEDVSFFAYVAATLSYHHGCYYPKHDMAGFVQALVNSIIAGGGDVRNGARVTEVEAAAGNIKSVTTSSGERLEADTFIVNTDPRQFLEMAAGDAVAGRLPQYEYSLGLTSIYLGISDIDALLPRFGPWNIWYAADCSSQRGLYNSDPRNEPRCLYLNSPTLVTQSLGSQNSRYGTVTGFVPSSYESFAAAKASGGGYDRLVSQHREQVLKLIARRFIPDLTNVLDICEIRTPWDNEDILLAPHGNVYGRRLTVDGVLQKIPWKGVLDNLYFVGSVVGYPGVASVIQSTFKVYEELTGDRVD